MGMYEQIQALREEHDAQSRGYKFEQLVREMLPWSFRPPVALSTASEQIDAFFEWNGWHFLVECKAKKAEIQAGSHDWEDFELKVQKRRGMCIGVFASLWNVSDRVYQQAEHLNRDKCTTVIIAGQTWDDLYRSHLTIEDFIRYMVLQSRARHVARHPPATDIKKWCFDQKFTEEKVGRICQAASSTFMRRHKLIRHQDIYLPRKIDQDVRDMSVVLRSSKLSMTEKAAVRGDIAFQRLRARPRQVALIRDMSGSGKTTLSIQIAIERKTFLGMGRAALEPDIDNLPDYMTKFGSDFGINELITLDRPLVYVIDSLDEASTVPQKRKEVRALFKVLDELNEVSLDYKLIGFPILILFTIREDLWRDWESIFEGRELRTFTHRFSYFSSSETQEALAKYSRAYSYSVEGATNVELVRILSHPFSMQVFSEAHEYAGLISPREVFSHGVMSLYFEKKKEDVLKRPIPGFQGDAMLFLCSEIAVHVANKGLNQIDSTELIRLIGRSKTTFQDYADDIARSLVSEQILVRDPTNSSVFRFRHMRFIEYLIAYHIALKLHMTKRPNILDNLTSSLLSRGFVSIYYVHDFVRDICISKFPETYKIITKFYAESSEYMRKILTMRRLDVGRGNKTSGLDIDAIRASMAGHTPDVCWEGYFILSAGSNSQKSIVILEAFELAWDSNPRRLDRWKVLTKLRRHRLLLHEAVLLRISASHSSKEWQVYLDEVSQSDQLGEFPQVWTEFGGPSVERLISRQTGTEWDLVRILLYTTRQGQPYRRGELI